MVDPSIEVKPSERALIQVRKMARKAAKTDNWLKPCSDGLVLTREDDYGDFSQAHQEAWEQTQHFSTSYADPLRDLADKQAERFGFTSLDDWETWHYNLYCPLKDTFWEEWEARVNLSQLWEDYKKGRRKNMAVAIYRTPMNPLGQPEQNAGFDQISPGVAVNFLDHYTNLEVKQNANYSMKVDTVELNGETEFGRLVLDKDKKPISRYFLKFTDE